MLQLKNISKKFNKQIVLDSVNYNFSHAGLYYLLGESGSGKTTLINIIASIEKQDSGEVIYNGLSLNKASSNIVASYRHSIIGMIFQNFNLVPYFSVNENFKLVNGRNQKRYQKFKDLLTRLGVEKLIDNYPHQISGGEQQRVALSRTLAFNHKIIIADEPTGSLDSSNAAIVMNELVRVSKEKLVIVITHDIELTNKYKGTIIKIQKGIINGKEAKSNYFEVNNLVTKNIDLVVIIKNALKSIKLRKLNYILLVAVVTLILSSLLIVLSAFNGFRSYSQHLSSTRIDSNYFNVYKYVNQESVYFKIDELNLDQSNLELSIDYENLANNYFKQLFSLPDNDFYEVKIINGLGSSVYVNSLFDDLYDSSVIKLDGYILVPYKESSKFSYERIKIEKEVIIENVIKETNIYNVAKVYLSFDHFISLFEEVKLPLIASKINLDTLNFSEYHFNYSEYIGLYGLRFDFDNYYKRKEISEQLALRDDVFTFFNSPFSKDFFQLRLNDEIFETTLSELTDSLELIVSILALTLVFTLVNIGALVISYSFRKRRFELSILKVFGATNFELLINLIFEVAIVAIAVMLLTALIYLVSYSYMRVLISNGNIADYNYLPISFTSIVQIASVLMFVLVIGSTESIRSIYRINVSENLRND
jgi:ABC-type lipoprotein export system ATPase subunit